MRLFGFAQRAALTDKLEKEKMKQTEKYFITT
jgi:hypothetical protein